MNIACLSLTVNRFFSWRYFIDRLQAKFRDIISLNKSYEDIYCLQSLGVRSSYEKALELDEEPYYYHDGIGYKLTPTYRKRFDLPTVTIHIPKAKFPAFYHTLSFCDTCLRRFASWVDQANSELYNRSRSDLENGKMYADHPESIIGSRNSCYLEDDALILMILVQLPVRNPKKGMRMLTRMLPAIVRNFMDHLDHEDLERREILYQNQLIIRRYLEEHHYVSFIANSSLLARDGETRPLAGCLPFQSCPEDEIEIPLLHGTIKGLGMKEGVTVFAGGAYSGKTTIINAILSGVYNHVQGDGREYVITREDAVKIMAEDGRFINHVDISMFINTSAMNAGDFSCRYASGSTSQAASVVEAVSMNVRLLILDEDSTATNFMICDERMRSVIPNMSINPFNQRIRSLYSDLCVSSILVIGSCADYLDVSDSIYLMDGFQIKKYRSQKFEDRKTDIPWVYQRILSKNNHSFFNDLIHQESLEVIEKDFIRIDGFILNISQMGRLLTQNQVHAMAYILRYLKNSSFSEMNINNLVHDLYHLMKKKGPDILYTDLFSGSRFIELPRVYEIIMALNRIHDLDIVQSR